MIVYLAILLLLVNSALLIYGLFIQNHPSQEIITQVTGAVTLFLFWCSEYFSQSKCKPSGVIDFLYKLSHPETENHEMRNIVVV